MRQINPMAKAWSNASKSQFAKAQSRVFKKKREIKAKEYMDGIHEYERTFSDQGTGEMKIMKGEDAKALNDDLFQDFLAAVEKNKEGRSLERWKVVRRHVEQEK